MEVYDLEVYFYFVSVVIDFNGNIIVGDFLSYRIYILSVVEGKIFCKFGKFGCEEGEF